MSIRPFRDIKRKTTKEIKVGNVLIGNHHPISVQSMTNTLTTNEKATIKQIEFGGSELRMTLNTSDGQELISVCRDSDFNQRNWKVGDELSASWDQKNIHLID